MEDLKARLTTLVAAGCDPRTIDDQGKTPSEYIQNDSIWSMWISVLAEAGKETRNEKRRPSHLPVSQFHPAGVTLVGLQCFIPCSNVC
jgi:hypothetical protein